MKAKPKKRGPIPKPASEIKVPIKIWVKKKYAKAASVKVSIIEDEYNNLDLN